eukprot:387009-Prymnesium_polylepis.1
MCKEVVPSWSPMLAFAPLRSSTRTSESGPSRHAWCSGVSPSDVSASLSCRFGRSSLSIRRASSHLPSAQSASRLCGAAAAGAAATGVAML